MKTVDSLESAAVENYAITLARSVLLSKEGKAAGYWEKPLIGKPRVTGTAYVIGTYTWFILGCSLAGLRRESTEQAPLLPEAESLVGYFLEFPSVKSTMDAHRKSTNEYAAKSLSPELADLIGGPRPLLTQPGVGMGRADEKMLTAYWEIMRQARTLTVEQGIDAFASLFLYGTCLPPSEVKRLWGIQAQASVVPLMERPLEEAQAETVAEISSLLEAQTAHRRDSGLDKAAEELIRHLQTMLAYQQLTMERYNDALARTAGAGTPANAWLVRTQALIRDRQRVAQYLIPALQSKLKVMALMRERHTAFPTPDGATMEAAYESFTDLIELMERRAKLQYQSYVTWANDPSVEVDPTALDSVENLAAMDSAETLNELIQEVGMRVNEEPWLGIVREAFNDVRAYVGLPPMSGLDFERRYFANLNGRPARFFRD